MTGDTKRLLVRFAAERGLRSARAIARELNVTPQSISLLLSGKRVMSAETALQVCDLLGLDYADTMRQLAAERERKRKRKTTADPPAPAARKVAGNYRSPFFTKRHMHQKPLI